MRFISALEKPCKLKLAAVLKKQPLLRKYFQKQPVDLVFLHGSLVKDQMKALSDVDFAILFHNEDYSYKNISEITLKLSELLGREDIDLAILNQASPLLWMQVLRNGKPIYCRNGRVLKKFRLQAIQRYLATSHLRRTFNKDMEAAILGNQ